MSGIMSVVYISPKKHNLDSNSTQRDREIDAQPTRPSHCHGHLVADKVRLKGLLWAI